MAAAQGLGHLGTGLVITGFDGSFHGSFSFLCALLQAPGLVGQGQRIHKGVQVAVDNGGNVEIFTSPVSRWSVTRFWGKL